MNFEKIERARQLLNVLEMREPRSKIESLIKLMCVQELNKSKQVIEIKR